MTKRAQWVQMPVEPADAWFAQRHYERALGADMFRVFGSDEVIDVPLSAFPEVICRRLAVDGRDRPTVKRAIERLVEAGLVVADGPRTHLLYSQRKHREWTVNGRSSVSERPVNDQSSSGERAVSAQSSVSESGSSARNDSTGASQIDREKERKKERKSGAGASPSSAAAPAVSPGERVRELEARYDLVTVQEARRACALSRRGGKISDSVWADTLERMASADVGIAEKAMRTFVERYADGQRDERYLLGIVRGELRTPQPVQGHLRDVSAPPAETFEQKKARLAREQEESMRRAGYVP